MVGKGEGGAIVVKGGVTNGVNNVLWHKLSEGLKQKRVKILYYTLQHKTM